MQQVKILQFPCIQDPRGQLTFIENLNHIPFKINRIFYLYDVPVNTHRGGHCHKIQQQVLIAIRGTLEIILQDGFTHKTYMLDKPHIGLYVPAMIWSDQINFTEGAMCLVLTSHLYDEADYIRDYGEYLRVVQGTKHE